MINLGRARCIRTRFRSFNRRKFTCRNVYIIRIIREDYIIIIIIIILSSSCRTDNNNGRSCTPSTQPPPPPLAAVLIPPNRYCERPLFTGHNLHDKQLRFRRRADSPRYIYKLYLYIYNYNNMHTLVSAADDVVVIIIIHYKSYGNSLNITHTR